MVRDVLRRRQRGARARRRHRRRRRRARRSRSTSATFPPGPPVDAARDLDRQAHRRPAAARCRTACRRRASTRSGTCPRTATADATLPLDLSPTCSAAARPRGSTSGWSTRTDRDRRRRLPRRPRDRQPVLVSGHGAAGRRPRRRSSGARRGDCARFIATARRRRARARAQTAVPRRLRARHRAHRRLRRQVRRARARRRSSRRPRRLQGHPRAHRAARPPTELQQAGAAWLTRRRLRARGAPFPELHGRRRPTSIATTLPGRRQPPEAPLPAVERATLSNGLKVVLARAPRGAGGASSTLLRRRRLRRRRSAPSRASPSLAMAHARRGHDDARPRSQISDELAALGAQLRRRRRRSTRRRVACRR